MSLYSLKISRHDKFIRKDCSLPGNTRFLKLLNLRFHFSHKETPRRSCFPAGFTLEAAVILPLAASFFVSILFFFRMMQIQLVVQKALDDTGRQLAVYSAEENAIPDLAVAEMLFLKELGEQELADEYILGGKMGISLLQSEFDGRDVCVKADYLIRLPIQIFWTRNFVMEQHADCRKWNGWKPGDSADGEEQWVYITETGSVYHSTSTCSHLELSIRSVQREQITELRSENGGKYYKCKECGGRENAWGTVYITNQGNRYHNDLNCSGIKRTIYMVRLSEVEERRSCSRCCTNEAY